MSKAAILAFSALFRPPILPIRSPLMLTKSASILDSSSADSGLTDERLGFALLDCLSNYSAFLFCCSSRAASAAPVLSANRRFIRQFSQLFFLLNIGF